MRSDNINILLCSYILFFIISLTLLNYIYNRDRGTTVHFFYQILNLAHPAQFPLYPFARIYNFLQIIIPSSCFFKNPNVFR